MLHLKSSLLNLSTIALSILLLGASRPIEAAASDREFFNAEEIKTETSTDAAPDPEPDPAPEPNPGDDKLCYTVELCQAGQTQCHNMSVDAAMIKSCMGDDMSEERKTWILQIMIQEAVKLVCGQSDGKPNGRCIFENPPPADKCLNGTPKLCGIITRRPEYNDVLSALYDTGMLSADEINCIMESCKKIAK